VGSLVWRCFGKKNRSGADKGKGNLKRADCERKVREEAGRGEQEYDKWKLKE